MTVTPVGGFVVPGPMFRRGFDHGPVAVVGHTAERTDLEEQRVGLVSRELRPRQSAPPFVAPYRRPLVRGR